MHASAYNFASTALEEAEVRGKTVIEAGSMDVNGTVRPAVEAHGPAGYTSTDMRPGAGVDVECLAEELPARFGADCADVVISTEMLEHAADWQAAMTGMTRVLKPGGLLVLTTRGPGFPLHGYPEDHWRFTVDAMSRIVKALGLEVLRLEPDPEAPGVFVKARKPDGWAEPDGLADALDAAGVIPMEQG